LCKFAGKAKNVQFVRREADFALKVQLHSLAVLAWRIEAEARRDLIHTLAKATEAVLRRFAVPKRSYVLFQYTRV
jgi:hypothetical protein